MNSSPGSINTGHIWAEMKSIKKTSTVSYFPIKIIYLVKIRRGREPFYLPSKYWHCRFSTSSIEVAFPCWKRCRVATRWGTHSSDQPCTATTQHGVSFLLTSTSFSASVAQKSWLRPWDTFQNRVDDAIYSTKWNSVRVSWTVPEASLPAACIPNAPQQKHPEPEGIAQGQMYLLNAQILWDNDEPYKI